MDDMNYIERARRRRSSGGGGGSAVLVDKTITANGEYDPADDSADGYSGVTVNVSGGSATLVTKSIAANGTYDASSDSADGYSSVTVNVSGGADSVKVDFRDYDGTLVYSYSAAEFAALTEMPVNPSHTGLTAQGWNWTLEDAKTYVANEGSLCIGQNYATDDGKTRIYITLRAGYTEPTLRFASEGDIVVEWGDGSENYTTTTSGSGLAWITAKHSYPASGGSYVIKITSQTYVDLYGYTTGTGSNITYVGSWILTDDGNQSNKYSEAITKVELGTLGCYTQGAFRGCRNLESITCPTVSYKKVADTTFYGCEKLSFIAFPPNVNTIGASTFRGSGIETVSLTNSITSIPDYAFTSCLSLVSMSVPSSVTGFGYNAFNGCSNLRTITLPNSIATIPNYAFENCVSLLSVKIPQNATVGYGAFKGCCSLRSAVIPSGASLGHNVFDGCRALNSVTIQNGFTTIPYSAFSGCTALLNISIPDSVNSIAYAAFSNCTSLRSFVYPNNYSSDIGQTTFNACSNLQSVEISAGTTAIGYQAFKDCSKMRRVRFKGQTPPTVGSSTAWTNIPTDCIIEVPAGALEAYTTAENYPSSSTYTYVEYTT